jgi:predicted ATPase
MIKQFRIANFKSYRKATLPLAPLTLLIGANASGKSNAIEALRLLATIASGRRLSEIFQKVQADEIAIRGTLADLAYAGSKTLTLGCVLQRERSISPWIDLALTLELEPSGMRVAKEHIAASDDRFPLYRVEPADSPFTQEIPVSYNNFSSHGGRKPRISCTNQQAVFTQLTTPARFGSEHTKAQQTIPKVTSTFQQQLEQILFLDPNPRRMRDYSFIVDNTLQGDGANLSSVLYDLVEQQGQRDQVLAFIRALPEQDIHAVGFLKGPRNEVMVRLSETFGGNEQMRDAPLLSDGTLRVLAVAAALLSAPEGSLVVIEEIDNGVHPSRAQQLLEQIQRVALERSLRVLLTTHNPALLDALPTVAIPDVVCCYRDPQRGDSRLVRLADLARYPELVAQGSLGDLVTRGVLDRFLKARQTPNERRQAALDWLAAFDAEVGEV